jgi:hypothetical protein
MGGPIAPALACLPAKLCESRRLAASRHRLSRGAWLFPSTCRIFSGIGRSFNRRCQFRLGLFRSAVVALVERLDARSFVFYPQLSVATFLALVFQVFGNRFSCHERSVAELFPAKLCNCDQPDNSA